jgi:formylglycine-generating enzyme required for sulfatase activity
MIAAMFRAICLLAISLCSAAAFEREVSVPLDGGGSLVLVRIERGRFSQGSPNSELGRGADETLREVTITKPFYLGKFPVTRGQFARFVSETGYRTEAEKGTSGGFGWDGAKLVQRRDFTWRTPGFDQTDDHPVVLVTWNDAKAFLAWLSRKTSIAFELPTEAQWEYAARAGATTAYANGGDLARAGEVLWHRANASLRTHPVGEKGLNAWALGDMAGHVWEWCADWYAPYEAELAVDPLQTNSRLSDQPRRVLRGGSWLKEVSGCRFAARYRNDPASRNPDNSFRVMAHSLEPSATIEATKPSPPAIALERRERRQSSTDHSFESTKPAPKPDSLWSLLSAFGGLCSCSGIGLVFVYFLNRMIRRATDGGSTGSSILPSMPSSGSGSTEPAKGALPKTRMVEDGFWLEGGSLPAGTSLLCRFFGSGEERQIKVKYEGRHEGQFIYTGIKPERVSLIVLGAAMTAIATEDALSGSDQMRREREGREDRQRSDPRAY